MPFSRSTARTRLSSGVRDSFPSGTTDAQKNQRINEVLDRFYDLGTWRGVTDTVEGMTTSSGILTLSAAYQRADALAIPDMNVTIPIKSQEWAFSKFGPRPQDWTEYCGLVAIDLGETGVGYETQITNQSILDSVTGLYYNLIVSDGVIGIISGTEHGSPPYLLDDTATSNYWKLIVSDGVLGIETVTLNSLETTPTKQYRITGNTDEIDAYAISGLCRKRFNWLTSDSALIFPDSFQSLKLGVQALHFEDEGDYERSSALMQMAMETLNGNLDESEPEEKQVSVNMLPGAYPMKSL